ncbi:ATP-binding protein [Leptospira sp. 96542]|nr:ATP-binding protein [Leptospira sp. 96542]
MIFQDSDFYRFHKRMISFVMFQSIQKRILVQVKSCSYPLILLGCLFSLVSCLGDNPTTLLAKDGQLDVEINEIATKNFRLDGEWQFFPNQFLSVENQKTGDKMDLSVGDSWTKTRDGLGNQVLNFGFGTYHLQLQSTNQKLFPDNLALYIPPLPLAYRLFVDGKKIGENGIVSNEETTHQISLKPRIFSLPVTNVNQIDIQLEVSNYTFQNWKKNETIVLGTVDNLYENWSYQLIWTNLALITLILFSVYHLLIYQLNPTERISLRLGSVYFGIFLLAGLSFGSKVFLLLVPDVYLQLAIKTALLGFPITMYGGSYILFKMPSLTVYTRVYQFIKFFLIFVSLVIVLIPFSYLWTFYIYLEVISAIFILVSVSFVTVSVYFHKKFSVLNLVSLSFALLGSVIDCLQLLPFWHFFRPFGLFSIGFFIIPQTIGVSYGLINVYKRTENISKELYKRKEALEKKVKSRTTELENANRWKANFVSLISHDLRSPLNSVNQILDVIQFNFDNMKSDEKKKFLDICKNGITQSIHMLEQLLDVSRFDSIGTKLILTEFNINELLNETIESLETLATLKEIKIQKDTPIEVNVIADRTLIGEVFKNIITNAVKYSFPKSEIWVVLSIKGKWISLEFRDRGLGMSEEQIAKITGEDNVKSQMGTNGERGTGLGLKLSANILEAHFGKLRIKSVLGVGSSFEVSLSKSTKSVLLIDNSESFRNELAEVLRRNQWIVIEASNGEEGLGHLSRIVPTAIITDLNMPGMNGVSFIHEWEGKRGGKQVPIFLISSDAPLSGGESFLADEGLEDIVKLYISKMYKIDDICQMIESNL